MLGRAVRDTEEGLCRGISQLSCVVARHEERSASRWERQRIAGMEIKVESPYASTLPLIKYIIAGTSSAQPSHLDSALLGRSQASDDHV